MSRAARTDREALIAMLDRAKVVWHTDEDNGLSVGSDGGPKNEGYAGFVSVLRFDDYGNLKSWGTWE